MFHRKILESPFLKITICFSICSLFKSSKSKTFVNQNFTPMATAYLAITLTIVGMDLAGAAAVYCLYKHPFLETIKGGLSKELLYHIDDVLLLHGFECVEDAQEYLMSNLFKKNVVTSLKPYIKGKPNIKIYSVS